MAVFVYLFLSLLVFDAVRLVLRLCNKNILTPHFNAAGIGAAIGLCVFLVIYGALNARSIYTVNYNVALPPGRAGNIRVALISDLHISAIVDRAWVARIVETVNSVQPDMVCIAGDIFDGNPDITKDLPGVILELKRINAALGVYACLGNHDVDRINFSGGGGNQRIINILREAGIVPLDDEVTPVGENFLIAGRRDASPIGMNSSRKSAGELLGGLDRGRILIALDHQPTQFAQIENAGADILFCGHSHRGQLFPFNLVTRVIFKKAGGTHYGHWQGKTMQAVVTSGAGVWGMPLRVATHSEVAVIDIE